MTSLTTITRMDLLIHFLTSVGSREVFHLLKSIFYEAGKIRPLSSQELKPTVEKYLPVNFFFLNEAYIICLDSVCFNIHSISFNIIASTSHD